MSLPDHCAPETVFLSHISQLFGTCIPSPLAFLSTALGSLSILAWLFAQLPQIYKNWHLQSTSGLSIFFLVEWCLGDVSNLLGALFTHQATWQVAIGAYYVFVDLCLVGQWVWYERMKHGHPVFAIRIPAEGQHGPGGGGGTAGQGMEQMGPAGSTPSGPDSARERARPRIIFRAPTFQSGRSEEEKGLGTTPGGSSIYRAGSSFTMPSPSPRTMLMIACLIAVVAGSPIHPPPQPLAISSSAAAATTASPTPLEQIGTILSWTSTILYLGSRLPQLLKNWRRKSTAGLSPHLFLAAFCGNFFYSTALLTNPNAWRDFPAYGGGGWAGAGGNVRVDWVLAALPFFLGAAGVLGLDATVGVQFLIYGENSKAEKLVVVVEEETGASTARGRRWRRVSGWMRGWIPTLNAPVVMTAAPPQAEEREGLMARQEDGGLGYGTL